ncbi:hypothetical protein BST61_g2630 [Cercospora zeina]
MPVIVRANRPWKDIPEGWDRNQFEIKYSPVEVQNVSKSVCAIVSGGIVDSKKSNTVMHAGLQTMERAEADDVTTEIEINVADEEIKRWKAEKAAGSTPIEDADRNIELNQKERTRALKEQETAKAMMNLCNSLSADVDNLPWPDPNTANLDMRFNKQRVIASGSGFAFAAGFVMGSAHCIHHDDFSDQLVIFQMIASKNFQSTLSKPSRLSEQAYKQVDGLGTVEHGAVCPLKRVVLEFRKGIFESPADLQTSSDAPSPPPHALNETEYDLAIVEVHVPAGYHSWSPGKLTIADRLPQTGDEVHLLGHPSGLPMKYVSRDDSSDNIPQSCPIVRVIGSRDRTRTTFTADIDAFEGTSGGPLLRVNNGRATNEVVGIVVGGSDRSSQPMAGRRPIEPTQEIHSLPKMLQDWRQEFTKLGVSLATKMEFDDPRFGSDFGELTYHPRTRTFAFIHNRPGDIGNTVHANTFNRVDLVSGFTKPLSTFIPATAAQPSKSPQQTGRAFQFRLVITFSSYQQLNETLQPNLHCVGIQTPFSATNIGYYEEDDQGSMYGYEYYWLRDANELDPFEPPWHAYAPVSVGTFPNRELFESESGLCAIEKITFAIPGNPHCFDVTARLDAVYTFGPYVDPNAPRDGDRTGTENAIRIHQTFPCLRAIGNRGTWEAHIGRVMNPKCLNPPTLGSAWKNYGVYHQQEVRPYQDNTFQDIADAQAVP